MLLTEANSPDLEQRKGVIERLAADLTKQNIKFKQTGSTVLDIYNKVTIAQPIYTAIANKNGAFDLIDKSVEKAKLSKLPGFASALYGNYNDRGNLVSLNADKGVATSYYDGPNGIGMRHVYNHGAVKIMSSDDIRVASNGNIMFGHTEWNSESYSEQLVSIDVINNDRVVSYKKPGKRLMKNNPNAKSDWHALVEQYYLGSSKPNGEQLYKIALQYILKTIDSTTVNAAIKGGKDKYMIKPAEDLLELLEDVFSSTIIDDNLDEVSAENAEHPKIVFTPSDNITIKITIRRPSLTAKGVQYDIYNIDKTILYSDVKANREAINTPGYEIKLKSIVNMSVKNDNKRRELDDKSSEVVRFIVNYIKANYKLVQQAAKTKAEMLAFTKKVNDRAAADKAKQAKDVEKTRARLDRRDAAKTANNPTKIDDVASSLWGSDDEYDEFLDSLL